MSTDNSSSKKVNSSDSPRSLDFMGDNDSIEVMLRFNSDMNVLSEGMSSEVVRIVDDKNSSELRANWDDELIPAIVPLNGDFLYIRSQCIIITVRVRRAQDAMFHRVGYAEIPLSSVRSDLKRIKSTRVGNSGPKAKSRKHARASTTSIGLDEQHFDAPLFLRGVNVGRIQGSVRLRNVIQLPSSSLAKRWRRRSDFALALSDN